MQMLSLSLVLQDNSFSLSPAQIFCISLVVKTKVINLYLWSYDTDDEFLILLIKPVRLVSHTPKYETESHHKRVYSVDTPITYVIKTLLKSIFFSPPVCEYSLQTPSNPWTRFHFHEPILSELVQDFTSFYGNQESIILSTWSRDFPYPEAKLPSPRPPTQGPFSYYLILHLPIYPSSVKVSLSEIRIDFPPYQYVPPAVNFPTSFIWSSE